MDGLQRERGVEGERERVLREDRDPLLSPP